MAMSSPGTRKVLIALICVFSVLLILLCVASAFAIPQPGSPSSHATQNSSESTVSKPTDLPGTSSAGASSSDIPGTSSTPTVPGTSTTQPTEPAVTTEPTTKPTEPSVPTEPTTKPTEPSVPTEPTTEPTEPSVPTEPTTKPTEPSVPTEPTTKPTEPSVPTEPTTKPTEPSVPTEPTTKPTEPSVPTTPTTEPTPPTQPTVPAFDEKKFFSESVFLGDSLTLGLSNYCRNYKDALPGARFLCAASYAVRHAIGQVGGQYVVSISYQGTRMRPEDALAAMGAKRVFIMLGLNDIGLGVNWTMKNYDVLIKNIRSKCPDIEIYIQSGTPVYFGSENNGLTNENMDRYNLLLEQYCKDNGFYFINVAKVLKNSQGGLKKEYTSDYYVHLNYTGTKAWVDYLKAYVAVNHK